jgi:[NiFe] hydrogenase assembly HybE family chaperone
MNAMFEQAYLDDGGAALMECGVCWKPYDPAAGDLSQNIAPGTDFSDLPSHWRCPACDSEKSKFVLLAAGAVRAEPIATSAAAIPARIAALEAAFRARENNMRDLPIYNGLLRVEAVGFRPFCGELAGVLITPWFMNIMLAPIVEAAATVPDGTAQTVSLPCGAFEFLTGQIKGVGAYRTCSLFSPVHQFADQAVARLTAQAATDELFKAPAPVKPVPRSRRELLLGQPGG